VVCLDTVMIDFTLMITALPEPGGDSLSSRRLVSAGGGFNMMSAARRQGLEALYLGQLGAGPFADIARDLLGAEGIEVLVAARDELDLGVCVVLVDQTGERTFVTSSGAELTIRSEELSATSLGARDVVYVSGYNVVYPQVADIVSEWLGTLAPEVVVAFDPGPRAADIEPTIIATVLRRTDWLLANAREARLLSGDEDVADCARTLRERWNCDRVVVRDGKNGCVSVGREGTLRAPGFRAVVVDTNGAGDVHNGVVIAELARGTSPLESLLRANAAAAIAIASLGPATCPPREAVDALLLAQPRSVTRP
jgi:sugar/nucleoside kinase (ribokinase family)